MIPNDPGFYKELLDHMSDGVYFVDRDRQILYWNEGAFRLTGYSATDLLGRRCQDDILCHVDYTGKRLCGDGCPLNECMIDGHSRQARVFLQHKQGHRVPVHVRAEPIRDTDGSIVGAIEIFSDDSAQAEAERRIEEMRQMAYLDDLTRLPNRRYLETALASAFDEFQRNGIPFGILAADLDEFKQINDTYGHPLGDRALQEASRALAASLRPSDVVGRWGGDEFLAIIRNADSQRIRSLAERCVTMVSHSSVTLDDNTRLDISVSIGAVVVWPGATEQELLLSADRRMYKSKAGGGNRFTAD